MLNALTLISNRNAQILAEQQSGIDTTAPVVDSYRPEADTDGMTSTPNKKIQVGDSIYHTLFVAVFLFGSIMLLGNLTGELDIDLPDVIK